MAVRFVKRTKIILGNTELEFVLSHIELSVARCGDVHVDTFICTVLLFIYTVNSRKWRRQVQVVAMIATCRTESSREG